jgi:hypothetical protein
MSEEALPEEGVSPREATEEEEPGDSTRAKEADMQEEVTSVDPGITKVKNSTRGRWIRKLREIRKLCGNLKTSEAKEEAEEAEALLEEEAEGVT